MTNVQTLLRHAERDAEKIAAIIRVIVFLSLALAIFSAGSARGFGDTAWIATGLYGLGAAVGLFLAWRRIFHPAIPYLFATFDVILVVAQVLMLARLMGMQAASPFGLPGAALIFVFLIHPSMRYRPWLIVYAAVLFMVSIELGPFFLAADPQTPMMAMPSMTHGGAAGLLNYQALPLTLIASATLILFVIGRRTRSLLE